MKQFFSSLYGKISAVFLVLLLVLGAVQMYVTAQSCIDLMDETRQKINAPVARNIATNIEPYLDNNIDFPAIEMAVQGMMAVNPELEIYLLDSRGKILASYLPPGGEIRLTTVSLDPIHQFLKNPEAIHCTGDDPCRPGRQKLFSASPVSLGNHGNGFVYVVRGAEEYHSALTTVLNSHIGRSALQVLLITLIFTSIIGLALFGFLTRRFHLMTRVVKDFEKGDLNRRIPIQSNDEIGQLAGAFNQMADTIAHNIEEINAKDRMRRDLIANISHDLRSPLASIQGYLETILLKDEKLPPEKRRRILETIFKNTKQLGKLVSELFELSKLDAKQVQPRLEAFCLAELAQDVVLKFQTNADARNIKLKIMIAENIPRVYGDIGMIERALSNLIDNALSYTPPDGIVTVELAHKDKFVRIKVADTGRGIPAEDIPHVFDRFYRVEKSRTRTGHPLGAGLGLAITKKIVEAHNGVISVKSAMDLGTCFSFRLPVSS